MTTPVSLPEVSKILEESRFKKLQVPFSLSGISFSFPAAFLGQQRSNDLVLILDTNFESESRISRRVQGLTRALDLAGSRKPLTTVVLGKNAEASFLESLSYLSRVIPLQGASFQEAKNRLAILLPLEIPQPNNTITEPLTELLSELEDFEEPLRALAQRATEGSASVREHLIDLINSELIDEEGTKEWFS